MRNPDEPEITVLNSLTIRLADLSNVREVLESANFKCRDTEKVLDALEFLADECALVRHNIDKLKTEMQG